VTSIAILGSATVVLLVVAYLRGGWELPLEGLRTGTALLLSIAPQLVVGFMLAGVVTVLLPREALGTLVGANSGIVGILVATGAGIITPGGPFLQFPLVAALVASGAAPGPVAAYLTAWSLMGWHRLVIWEIPLLGTQFTLARFLVSLVLPVLVGLLLPTVLRLVEVRPAR
jgi:uncharacterized membrane protein YraQ (UPF0718 family)